MSSTTPPPPKLMELERIRNASIGNGSKKYPNQLKRNLKGESENEVQRKVKYLGGDKYCSVPAPTTRWYSTLGWVWVGGDCKRSRTSVWYMCMSNIVSMHNYGNYEWRTKMFFLYTSGNPQLNILARQIHLLFTATKKRLSWQATGQQC